MSKGKRREKQAAELYERAGYETYRPQESKFGETDMFGLFDMVAMGRGEVRLVQIKSTSYRVPYTEWFEDVAEWVTSFDTEPPKNVIHDFLVCYSGEGWRLIGEGADDGSVDPQTFLDEREMSVNMGEGVVAWLNGGGQA